MSRSTTACDDAQLAFDLPPYEHDAHVIRLLQTGPTDTEKAAAALLGAVGEPREQGHGLIKKLNAVRAARGFLMPSGGHFRCSGERFQITSRKSWRAASTWSNARSSSGLPASGARSEPWARHGDRARATSPRQRAVRRGALQGA